MCQRMDGRYGGITQTHITLAPSTRGPLSNRFVLQMHMCTSATLKLLLVLTLIRYCIFVASNEHAWKHPARLSSQQYANLPLLHAAVDMIVLQVWNEEDPEDEVLALVVRTGFNSTMGNMLRQIVCPIDSVKWKQDPFLLASDSQFAVFHLIKVID